jgi:hypothetical protein
MQRIGNQGKVGRGEIVQIDAVDLCAKVDLVAL